MGFADVQLSIEKCSLAKAQQEKRAHAEAFLDEAMIPEPIAAGLPHSALLRLNIDRLTEALEAGVAGSARPALMLRAQKMRQQAGKAQRELSTMLVLAMGKFRKLAKDVKARELARRRLLEAVRVAMAQLELTFPPLDVETCDAERVEQACAVAEGQSEHAGACQAHVPTKGHTCLCSTPSPIHPLPSPPHNPNPSLTLTPIFTYSPSLSFWRKLSTLTTRG